MNFGSWLLLLFVALKLLGVITWPWLWVLAPLWIPVGILLVAAFGFFLVFVGMACFAAATGGPRPRLNIRRRR